MAFINFQPKDYFNTKLYTGNSTNNNSITGVGFAPDFTWIKARANTYDHMLFDSLRGTASVRDNLRTNSTSPSDNDSTNVKTLDSDGFTLGTGGYVNNTVTFTSWNWKANGAGSSNSNGSITSTVSASTNSGFSIVKWTASGGNATIGHGLGAVPKMIIVKSLANTTNYMVYHTAIGNNSEMYLNGNSAAAGSSTAWQDTDPTSSVFYVAGGAGDGVNASGDYLAYCFAEKKGFSKFGRYTGVANVNGPFIYTGFSPAFVMIKRYDSGTLDWNMYDSKRPGFNETNKPLWADSNDNEANVGTHGIDLLSNGFKIKSTNDQVANNGASYLFMAFAKEPLVSSNGVAATAR